MDIIKTHEAVVQRGRQVLKVEPNIEGRLWRDGHLQTKTCQTFENMVSLVLEMPLQRNLLLMYVLRVKQGDRRQLQSAISSVTFSGKSTCFEYNLRFQQYIFGFQVAMYKSSIFQYTQCVEELGRENLHKLSA